MCGDCAERPELEICPQCRVVLAGRLSRNRALEELARKTFPREEEESRRLRAARGGAGAGAGGRVRLLFSCSTTGIDNLARVLPTSHGIRVGK